jgi:hypothetical protein
MGGCDGKTAAMAVGLVLVLSLFGLQVATLAAPKWSRLFEDTPAEVTIGLFTCEDCYGDYDDIATVYCFETEICDENPGSGACKNFHDLVYGGQIYLTGTIVSWIFGLMVFERLIYQMAGKGANHPGVFYLAAFGQHAFQVIATAVWFDFSEAEFDADCDESPDFGEDDKYDICALDGPVLAIVSIMWSFFVWIAVTLIYHFKHHKEYKHPFGEFKKIFGYTALIWIWKSFLLQLLSFALIIAGMTSERFLQANGYYGSMMGLSNNFVDGVWTYDCYQVHYCEKLDDADGYCDTFEALNVAGGVAYVLDVVALLCLGLWVEHTASVGLGLRFGFKYSGEVAGIFAFILHLLAVIVWNSIPMASYDDDCEDGVPSDPDDEWDVCPEIGANMFAAAVISLGLALINAFVGKRKWEKVAPPSHA